MWWETIIGMLLILVTRGELLVLLIWHLLSKNPCTITHVGFSDITLRVIHNVS